MVPPANAGGTDLIAAARRHHLAGSRTRISLVALSTAAFVNGNARGVTFRQSSSWSFQCGLFGQPDSPKVIPCCVWSQLLGSAIRRIETLLPTLTVGPRS